MNNDHKYINQDQLQYVIDSMPQNELLCQLAEEASEMAHAALKLRRVYDQTNPTPVSEEDALKNMYEEIADIWLTLKALGLDEAPMIAGYQERMAAKVIRWANRLDGGME